MEIMVRSILHFHKQSPLLVISIVNAYQQKWSEFLPIAIQILHSFPPGYTYHCLKANDSHTQLLYSTSTFYSQNKVICLKGHHHTLPVLQPITWVLYVVIHELTWVLYVVIELAKILNLMNQRGLVHLSKIKILRTILQHTVEESQFAVAHDSDIWDDTVQVQRSTVLLRLHREFIIFPQVR